MKNKNIASVEKTREDIVKKLANKITEFEKYIEEIKQVIVSNTPLDIDKYDLQAIKAWMDYYEPRYGKFKLN